MSAAIVGSISLLPERNHEYEVTPGGVALESMRECMHRAGNGGGLAALHPPLDDNACIFDRRRRDVHLEGGAVDRYESGPDIRIGSVRQLGFDSAAVERGQLNATGYRGRLKLKAMWDDERPIDPQFVGLAVRRAREIPIQLRLRVPRENAAGVRAAEAGRGVRFYDGIPSV